MDSLSGLEPRVLLDEAVFVRRLAKALVRRADLADDVAQDVFVAALQQRGDAPRHLRGWLAAITKRLAARARGAERRRSAHETAAAPEPADERERHTAERLQLQRRLCDAVLGLPEPHRTVVTLRFFDDLPPRVIAQRTQTSSDVVRQRLHRGLTMLRERLDRDFGDRRAWCSALAAAGLGAAGSPWLLLTVLTMNKLALGAAATLAVGAFLLLPRDEAPAPIPPVDASVRPEPVVAAVSIPADVPGEPVPHRTLATSASPECRVLVVDETRAPLAGAGVHCWDDSAATFERRTDAEGRCSFGNLGGPGRVLVIAKGRFPRVVRLEERRGDHEVVVPEGASIHGVLVVDGAPPGRRWNLALDDVELDAELPASIAEHLSSRPSPTAITDEAGHFSFAALPLDWQGGLRLPHALWALPESGGTPDRPRTATVRAGDHDVRIAATHLPTMHVRVTWEDDGSRVAHASVGTYAEFEGTRDDPGSSSPSLTVSADEAGEASVGLHSSSPSDYVRWCAPKNRPGVQRAVLWVSAREAAERVERRLSAGEFATTAVHEVRLRRAAKTHFVVVAKDSTPIVGARVEANGTSGPTDRDGRGTFAGTAKDVKRVGAPNHRIGVCAPRAIAAGTLADPLVFELEPANALTLRVLGTDGRPAPFVTVALHSNQPPFTSGELASDLDSAFGNPIAGATATTSDGPDGRSYTHCETLFDEPVNGMIELHSLEPGLSAKVVVRDPMRRPLVERELTMPRAGERATIDLLVPGTPRELHGHVLDAADRPIADAKVQLAVASRDAKPEHDDVATTDRTGAFRFTGVYSVGPLRLTATADGHAPRTEKIVALDEATNERTLRLERGYSVTVRCIGTDGAAVPVDLRIGDADAPRGDHDDLGPGIVRWRNLPPSIATFWCSLGGIKFSVQHDTQQPEAVLRVPTPGRLAVARKSGWKSATPQFLKVALHRLDEKVPAHTIWSPERGDEHPLVPGRYRVDLISIGGEPGREGDVERTIASTEVAVTAGTLTRAELP